MRIPIKFGLIFSFCLIFNLLNCISNLEAVEPNSDEIKMIRKWSAPFWNSDGDSSAAEALGGIKFDAHQKGVSVKYRINTGRTTERVNLGGKSFEKGFFIHANAKLEIIPPQGARRFSASFGLEKNPATKNGQGSVKYIVRQSKKDLYVSPVLRGNQPPVSVEFPINDASPIQIEITDSGDGISCDHGALGNAKLIRSDGSFVYVSDLPLSADDESGIWPFSFKYDGVSSRTFLKNWKHEIRNEELNDGRTVRTLIFTDPKKTLQVICRFVEYTDFPTLEWTLYFKNISSRRSPIISEIKTIDKTFFIDAPHCVLHHANGSDCMIDDFQQFQSLLRPNEKMEFQAANGRGTDGVWPYYNIEAGNRGVIAVIGWPGQWKSVFTGLDQGFHLDAGQERTRFYLNPGESVRSPLSVIQFWKRDSWFDAQNIWRQWMIRYNVPRHNGKLETSIISAASSYWYDVMGTATDESQIFFIKRYLEEKIPLDYWWMDAGWYQCDKNWWRTGTWEIDQKRFPNGLRKVTDFARSKGIKNIVWFEPERVHGDSKLAREHQNWLLGKHTKTGSQLLNLGNPDAWNWCVSMVDEYIKKEGIEFYRQDFNTPADKFWSDNDEPDRQGITEIRHIEGYLAFWDEIRNRNPSIQIDTCASGGRRLDLETLRRSVPLTCSDYFIEPTGAQMQTLNLSLWVPFHGKNMLICDDYHLRSFFMPFMRFGADMRPNAQFALGWHPQPHIAPKDNIRDFDSARRNIAFWKEHIVPHYTGDFYPLNTSQDTFKEGTWGSRRRNWTTPMLTPSFEEWAAWQYNSPGKKSGIVQAFRRVQSSYESRILKLYGLERNSVYEITDLDSGRKQYYTGDQLMTDGLKVEIRQMPGAVLLSYRVADCRKTPTPPKSPAPNGWNSEVKTIFYPSAADHTWQPALSWIPKIDHNKNVPLLVVLHPWSFDYRQPHMNGIFSEIQKRNWAMICPDFRGINNRPEACGSDLAVADIVSAIDYMKKTTRIDPDRIYLFGISGGGFATMLMTARHPEIFGGASAWVGITDLALWHDQTRKAGFSYSDLLEKICGGAPGSSPETDRQYEHRSVKTWLKKGNIVPLAINAGIHDGHGSGPVPVSHSLTAFNILADEKDRLSPKQINQIVETEKIPVELAGECVNDPSFGSKKILFQRQSQNATVTLFDGGHEGIFSAAVEWLSKQKKIIPAP